VTSSDTATQPGSGPPPEAGTGVRRRRSFVWWLGVAMMLAGLALLAWVAWQIWGTNWTSQKEQRRITAQLEQDWRAGTGLQPKVVPQGEASALIRIPKFGKSYVIPVIEGTSQEVLAKGFGHFADTADPGQVGNYALAGHRITHGEPLRRMPDLRPGDKVIVETADATYTYVLDTDPNDLVIPFTGIWVLDPVPHNPEPGGVEPAQRKGQRLITLTTCSELFHTDNRMIAFGHLVTRTSKGAAAPRLADPQW
jgi:sortase A